MFVYISVATPRGDRSLALSARTRSLASQQGFLAIFSDIGLATPERACDQRYPSAKIPKLNTMHKQKPQGSGTIQEVARSFQRSGQSSMAGMELPVLGEKSQCKGRPKLEKKQLHRVAPWEVYDGKELKDVLADVNDDVKDSDKTHNRIESPKDMRKGQKCSKTIADSRDDEDNNSTGAQVSCVCFRRGGVSRRTRRS